MKKNEQILAAVFLLTFGLDAMAGSECKAVHDEALSQCKAYEHLISHEQISIIGEKTRHRVASQERDKLYGIGKACAKAQKKCNEVCSEELSEVMSSGKDFAPVFELKNDCQDGSIAKHRAILVKKYLSMKRVSEETRIPANQ